MLLDTLDFSGFIHVAKVGGGAPFGKATNKLNKQRKICVPETSVLEKVEMLSPPYCVDIKIPTTDGVQPITKLVTEIWHLSCASNRSHETEPMDSG